MKNIILHGLGQNGKSWNRVIEGLEKNKIQVKIPNLFNLDKNLELNYENVYRNFVDYCNFFDDKLNLCGLSLGGILAIYYAIEYPERVNSLIIIGTPYEIPKKLLKLQNFIFKVMPKNTFNNIGMSKSDFIKLSNSMTNIDIKSKTNDIKCPTLIVCGEKDKVNLKSAKQLNKNIKGSTLEFIEGAGHEINMEKPVELSKVIENYWNNL